MHTYLHVVDTQGAHWLVGPDNKSLFNGINWQRPKSPTPIKEELGKVTIEEFLFILKSKLNYSEDL